MSRAEKVLVIGATQGTGRHAVGLLRRDGYAVRVLARNRSRAGAVLGDEVEIVEGDLTRPETLPPALRGVEHVILTAGVTKRPAPERLVKATEYDGTLNVLKAAREAGLPGRLVYMSALGTTRWSILAFLLNLIKGNTLRWRRRGEEEIRRSGVDYTIVHAGILTDASPGEKGIDIGQQHLPMSVKYRIGREDAAEVLVRALADPHTRRATFDAVWSKQAGARDWGTLFARLEPDP
jgi:uncharacterized protein YbjT (DUF2867 family)